MNWSAFLLLQMQHGHSLQCHVRSLLAGSAAHV